MFFFFNDPPPPEIYTLSLHDALPIYDLERRQPPHQLVLVARRRVEDLQLDIHGQRRPDRKSTRLNSSHANISYAVFCLKKKKKNHIYKEDNISLDITNHEHTHLHNTS